MPSSQTLLKKALCKPKKLSLLRMGMAVLAVPLLSLVTSQPVQAATGINNQVNFQARLLNAQGATVPDGNYNIQFKIYQDGHGCVSTGSSPCGGTLLWTEGWLNNNTQGVTVKNGYFSVLLGSITSLSSVDFNQDTLWLSLNVGTTNGTCTPFSSCGGDGEMLPFKRFASNPYALNSGKLGGRTSDQFVQIAPGTVQADSSASTSIFLNKNNASGNILQLQKSASDVFVISNAGTVAINTNSPSALTVQNSSNHAFEVDSTNIKVGIGVASASATSRLSIAGQGVANGITLGDGASGSANLYVSANDTLKTDDALVVNAGLTVSSNGAAITGNSTIAGTLGSVTNFTLSGTISGGTTYSGSGDITSTGGSVIAATHTGSAAVTVSSGGSSALTLTSASGTAILGGSTNTVQRTNSTFALDVVNAGAASTLSVTNSNGSQVANLDVEGGLNIGSGQTYKINSADINTAGTLSNVAYKNQANTFTLLNTFQPTTNVSSVAIKQNSSGSFGQDVFNVQGSSSGNFIQVTSTAANQGAVTIASLGANDLSINSGSNIVSVGATNITGTGALTVASGGSNTNLSLNANGSGTASLDTGSTGSVTIANSNVAHTIAIGSGGTSTVQGITVGSATNTASTLALQGGTGASSISLTTGVNGAAGGGISIGNTTGSSTQTVTIGNGSTSATVTNTIIGSAASGATSSVKLQGSGITETISGSSDIIQTQTNSSTAFQVQSASALAVLFNVDTTVNASNLVSPIGASLETAASPAAAGWSAKTSATLAMSGSAALSYIGSQSLKITTATSIASGASYAISLTNGTTYTLSFQAKLDSASTNVFNTLSAGWSDGSDHDCVVVPAGNNTPVVSTQWNRYSCTFTPSATGANFYVKQTDALAHIFYIDAVQLETGSVATTFRTGTTSFGGSQLVASNLSACDQIITDTSGTLTCGSSLVDHISLIDGAGHSIMRAITQQSNGATSPDYRWTTRLANLLHAQEINRAVDASKAYSSGATVGGYGTVLQSVIPPRTSAPYLPRNGVGLLQFGINDLATIITSTGGATAGGLVDFKEGLRTMISRYRASAVFEENTNNASCASAVTCVSYPTGTWGTTTGTTYNSGTAFQTLTSATGSLSICVPLDFNATGGVIDLGIIAQGGGAGGTHTITVDGVAANTTNTIGLLTALNAPAGGTTPIEGIVRRLTIPAGAGTSTGCLSTSQHKIVDTITGVSSGTHFDYYQIEANPSTPVVVLNVAKQPDYSAYSSGPYVVPNDADVDTINTVISSLVTEFDSSTLIADENTALNKNPNFFSADKLHPSDQGHAQIANSVYKALVNAPITVQQATSGTIGPGFYNFTATNFAVQNTNQQPTLLINTTAINSTNLILNPSFEADAQNWIPNGVSANNTIARVTSQQYTGFGSLNTVTSGTANDGARYNLTLINSTTYTLSFYAKLDVSSAAFTTLAAGYINTTPSSVACTLSSNTVVTTGWTRYSCSFSAVNPLAAGGIWIGDSSASAHNFYIDAVQLQATGSINPYTEGGSINLIGNIVGPVNFQNTSDSTSAFTVQDASGSTDFINADTLNKKLGFYNTAPTNKITINTLTTADASNNTAQTVIGTAASGNKGLVVQGSAGQNVNIFEVQTSAGGSGVGQLFSVGQTSIQVGSATTDTTQILLQLDSFSTFADTAGCTTSSNQGALYYNTNTNAVRSCVNGGWEDLVTTGGLGVIAFGVITDTGVVPADVQSLNATNVASGPCRAYLATTTSVGWTACVAYSGGRKVVVAAGSTAATNGVANNFQHLCLNGTNSQPTLSTSNATETANLPTWNPNNPVLCLADLKFAAANNTISFIYDTRVFANSSKQYVYTTVAVAPGQVAVTSTNKVTTTATAATPVQGVVVASNGAAWAAGTGANAIMVTEGLAWVKATAGTSGQVAQTGTTAGYATTVANPAVQTGCGVSPTCNVPAPYTYLGFAQTTWSGTGTCTTAAQNTCGSILVNVKPR